MTMRSSFLMASLAASMAGALPPAAWAAGETPPPLPGDIAEAAEWYVVIDGQKVGPLTDSAVQRRLTDGTIKDDTLVWRAGMDGWTRAAEATGIQAIKVEAALKNPNRPTRTDNKFLAVAYRGFTPLR